MKDTSESHDWVIGCHIKVVTKHTNEEISGILFGYEPSTDVVVIKEPGSHGGVFNLRLYKGSQLQVVSVERNTGKFDMKLPYVDKERARQREDKALQQADSDMSKVGVGVTKEAQSIFDALSRTMPCTWQGRTIVVMNDVLVDAPYTVDSVRCTSNQANAALERVKKVLEIVRPRLGLPAKQQQE